MATNNFAEALAAAMNGGAAEEQSQSESNGSTQRDPVKVWGNLGQLIRWLDGENNVQETFISIPRGVPIDTQKPMTPRYDNEENNRKTEAGNAILAHWQEMADKLEPGEAVLIPAVPGQTERMPKKQGEVIVETRIEMRRIREPGNTGTAASGAENPYLELLKPAMSS